MASGGAAARAAEEPPPPEPPAEQKPPPPPPPPAQEEFSFLPLVHDIIKCSNRSRVRQRSFFPGAYTQHAYVILPSPKRDTGVQTEGEFSLLHGNVLKLQTSS
ncbi:mediator of RNA polymerase II transcription subunit 9 isoform X2 [Calonectris borealis]|uniref:mediator of RNA polymerase II transcription subunit 9 isoform X2 n=1 Tax=Calonectris borealis TaxID=1323832 RepID=UPI003F4C627D